MLNSGSPLPDQADRARYPVQGAAAAEGGSSFSLDQMLAVLRRRLLLIASVTALGTALFVGVASQLPPKYASTAVVAVDQSEPQLSGMIDGAQGRQGLDGVVATKIELISSPEILAPVMDQLHLYEDPAFNPPPDEGRLAGLLATVASLVPHDWLVKVGLAADTEIPTMGLDGQTLGPRKEAALHRFRRSLEVSQPPDAGALAISYSSTDRDKAALIANAIAEQYVRWEVEDRRQTSREAAAWLRQQLDQLQAAVAQAEQAVARFRVENGLAAGDGSGGTLNDQRLMDLKAQLVALRAEQLQKEAKLAQVRSARGSANGRLALASIVASPTLLQLRQQEVDLERRRAELAQVYGARHPQMLDVEVQLRTVAQKIALEVDQAIAAMEDELASLASREKAIQSEIASLQGSARQDREAEIQLRELERQAIVARERYETLLARYRQAVEHAEFPTSNARVISRATPAAVPSMPGLPIFAVVGFTASLMLGSMLAFVAEQLNRKVQSARGLERHLGIPALGILPFVKQRRLRDRPASYIAQAPLTYYAEATQGVLGQLERAAGGARPVTVMVTSALPDEGKTTLAVSLAAAAVRGGSTACVVDLDLRRSSVAGRFEPCPPGPGLVDYAAGAAALDDVVRWDAKSEVAFVPVGRRPKNPLLLIRSPAVEDLVAALRARFDLVVIDTPPILAVSEAVAAARLADQFVLAARWRQTETAAVAEAARRLLSVVGSRFVGFVVTVVDPQKYRLYGRDEAGGYYKQYRKYYVS